MSPRTDGRGCGQHSMESASDDRDCPNCGVGVLYAVKLEDEDRLPGPSLFMCTHCMALQGPSPSRDLRQRDHGA